MIKQKNYGFKNSLRAFELCYNHEYEIQSF